MRRRNSSEEREKKQNKQTNKQTKAEVQERELTKRREVFGFSGGVFFSPWVCSKLRDREKAASTRTRKRTASRRITRQRRNCERGGASYFRSSSNDDDEEQRREFDYYLGLVSSCSKQPVRVSMNY